MNLKKSNLVRKICLIDIDFVRRWNVQLDKYLIFIDDYFKEEVELEENLVSPL